MKPVKDMANQSKETGTRRMRHISRCVWYPDTFLEEKNVTGYSD
jgi:hypothetical protein